MTTNLVNNPKSVMDIIQNTKPQEIAALDFVKNKYIQNYNATNKDKNGELKYHRNMVYFNMLISANDKLKNADKFSLYACFVTAALNDYSLDPEDNDVYLIVRDGKAKLDKQTGAHLKRLIRTEQIKRAEQVKFVMQGDEFEFDEANSKVLKHIRKYVSEIIVVAYIKFELPDGKEVFFKYEKSDWESWRAKSPNPKTVEKTGQHGKYLSKSLWDNEMLDGIQPNPGFLRTKIAKHACNEKCWAPGRGPVVTEFFDVEVEDAESEEIATVKLPMQKEQVATPADQDDESFVQQKTQAATVVVETDSDEF